MRLAAPVMKATLFWNVSIGYCSSNETGPNETGPACS
jgi:hypothetical protein